MVGLLRILAGLRKLLGLQGHLVEEQSLVVVVRTLPDYQQLVEVEQSYLELPRLVAAEQTLAAVVVGQILVVGRILEALLVLRLVELRTAAMVVAGSLVVVLQLVAELGTVVVVVAGTLAVVGERSPAVLEQTAVQILQSFAQTAVPVVAELQNSVELVVLRTRMVDLEKVVPVGSGSTRPKNGTRKPVVAAGSVVEPEERRIPAARLVEEQHSKLETMGSSRLVVGWHRSFRSEAARNSSCENHHVVAVVEEQILAEADKRPRVGSPLRNEPHDG